MQRKRQRKISETPEELVARVDRLYLDLARVYARIGRLLGVRPAFRSTVHAQKKQQH